VARTALRTKLREELADQLTDIVVDAVSLIRKPDEPLDLFMVRGNLEGGKKKAHAAGWA
jgi:T-complex protein 1 subunit zeta